MKPERKTSSVTELLARELHRQYRAASKAMGTKGPTAHDHGVRDCGQKKFNYFRKRASLLLRRATTVSHLDTLGDALAARNAVILEHCIRLGITPEEAE